MKDMSKFISRNEPDKVKNTFRRQEPVPELGSAPIDPFPFLEKQILLTKDSEMQAFHELAYERNLSEEPHE